MWWTSSVCERFFVMGTNPYFSAAGKAWNSAAELRNKPIVVGSKAGYICHLAHF
jgi:hypothetical protein